MAEPRRRITVAVLALGGQGGGVLSDWLVAVGEKNGYYVQATSVQGVAQRTGSTVYYLELFPQGLLRGRSPVLALMPAPGDVDIVVASELMEAGRAILRGFVTRDRTTLVTSTHRIYAISEKSAVSGGIADSSKVLDAAAKNAKSVIAFDMESASARTGSAISAVMLGAVAASGALPFARPAFEAAIRDSGLAVDANLAGFAAGFDGIDAPPASATPPKPASQDEGRLRDRIVADLPEPTRANALEGVRRLLDYQDASYAALYLDRLAAIKALDDAEHGWALTRETARALALWMSYEDVMRVAQLKVRRARMAEVRDEVRAAPGQILHVTEYMHPRWEELCDTLPAGPGARLLGSTLLKRVFAPWFERGRHVRTTNIAWFLVLRVLAARRRGRRGTLRYTQEDRRIQSWLAAIAEAASTDRDLACELAQCQNLIKGYGDTHERGVRKFTALMDSWRGLSGTPDAALSLRRLRQIALRDEDGGDLSRAVKM